jgi:hypothetical protein
MNRRQASRTGIGLYGAISLLVVGGGAFVAYRAGLSTGPAVGELAISSGAEARVAPVPAEAPPVKVDEITPRTARKLSASEAAAALVARLAALVSHDPADGEGEELNGVQSEIVALGEAAAPALVERIDALSGIMTASQRERLLDILRRLPGRVAEERLIREARSGRIGSSRSLAIESLGDRRSARAVDALARIAETDPDLPERPLITSPRDPSDTSSELPDEVAFTPRMQALSALAATRDARAGEVLTNVLHDGPDESLRMEAARHLEVFRESRGAVDALTSAATSDPSPYVRLAALHALAGSTDRNLVPMLESIALRDGDAGVRALARQVLASIRMP